MSKNFQIKWLNEPEDHNYPAAASYLSLIYDEPKVSIIIEQLKKAPITYFKAKDIFRVSGASLLGISNSHVQKDKYKIEKGIKLSPILLVRESNICKTIIADGYHRLCSVYAFDEDSLIPCKIV